MDFADLRKTARPSWYAETRTTQSRAHDERITITCDERGALGLELRIPLAGRWLIGIARLPAASCLVAVSTLATATPTLPWCRLLKRTQRGGDFLLSCRQPSMARCQSREPDRCAGTLSRYGQQPSSRPAAEIGPHQPAIAVFRPFAESWRTRDRRHCNR